MKSQDDGARYQKTAHILSFTLLILSLVFSIQQVFTRKTVDPSNISPHDTVLMLAFLYTALCLMVALLINYAKRVGKPRDLSFFVPLVIFAGLCADTLIFYKNNTGFFWLALFILYGIGALYNGFYKLLYFIIVSQVTMLLFFETAYWRLVFFVHEERFYWGVSAIAALFYLSLVHICVVKGKAARRGEYLSETLLTTTPNAIVLVDAMMCVIAMSNTFVRLFRIGDKNLAVGRPLVDLLPGDIKLLVMEICGNNGGYCEMIKELEIYNNTGYYRIICDKLSGNTPGLFINLVNVTPIMKAKIEVEKAAKAKNIFLAKMSHEIRTPLNAITGMSELILREETSQRVREYALGVQSAGTNLISIINDILDFSKIESGNMEISEAGYEVETLINDVINIIRMRLLDKPILFIANIDAAIPAGLIGDVVRVRQILINLLNNAVKYTANGFISLTVDCHKKDKEDVQLKIAVSDSGRGIKQVDFRRVFGEFVQLDMRHNIGIEGTGLGLAITKSLCKTMGGEIKLESEYGRGSTFTVTLPQRISSSQKIAEVKEAEKKRTLLYEGRELYARSISTALTKLGVPHAVAANFSELSDLLDKSAEDEWAFVFVVSLFYDSVRDLLQKKQLKPHIIVLADVNALICDNARSIAMPAHSISIAAVLNNSIPGKLNKETQKERWVAPDIEVLIVDDIQTNIVVAEGLMAPYKMHITGVLSGKEAIKLVFERRFDLVFMDHMMPEMDGIETVMTLRTTPNGRHVPIIALTANAIHGVEEMFRQNGFDDILVKPIEINKLDALLEKWVPKRKRKRYIPYLAKAVNVVAKTAARAAAAAPSRLAEADAAASPAAAGLAVHGLDTALGLKNTGGTEAFYITVLQSYAAEGNECLAKINGAFDGHDIKLLTTYIHGIKSSSANIGATEISDEAFKLENAGKNNDWNLIKSALPVFTRRFSELLDAIKETVKDKKKRAEDGGGIQDGGTVQESGIQESAGAQEGRPRSAFLKERIASFCDAADAYDSDAMEKSLDALAGSIWNKETADALEKIKSCVLLGEYEEAAQLARRLNAGLADG